MSDVIAKTIEASRERESRGRGPCPCESDEVCHCWMEYSIGLETWEPRFRDAFAVAVKAMRESAGGDDSVWEEEFARIAAILTTGEIP